MFAEDSNRPHRICIVDGDSAVRDSMRILLESYGFEVAESASSADFLRKTDAYCLLIVNHRMPETTGLELLEVLRAGGVETPAILMFDTAGPGLSERVEAVGDCVALAKPIAAADLVRTIKSSLESHACAHGAYVAPLKGPHEFSRTEH